MDEDKSLTKDEDSQESDSPIPQQCTELLKVLDAKNKQDHMKDDCKSQNHSNDQCKMQSHSAANTKDWTVYMNCKAERENDCTDTLTSTVCQVGLKPRGEIGVVDMSHETVYEYYHCSEPEDNDEYRTGTSSSLDVGSDDSQTEFEKTEVDLEVNCAMELCEDQKSEGAHYHPLDLSFESPPMVLDYKREFSSFKSNFTKGCKWSPDGLCLLVASNDKKLRIFNLPTPLLQGNFPNEAWFTSEAEQYEHAAVTVQERELVYDYTWYPAMRSDNPRRCCFAVTCRDQPVHLWDAWNGEMIASYSSYDHLDQMVAAKSTAFNLDGTLLVCGFNKCMRIFHTCRPGRTFDSIPTAKKGETGQRGIISCMVFHPRIPSVFMAGSYLGSIALYNTDETKAVLFISGMEGVTHLQFSADGNKLFTGMRTSDEILCYDMRNPTELYCRYRREVTTHQRIYFDVDLQNKYLVTGNTNGQVSAWNLLDYDGNQVEGSVPTLKPSSAFLAHKDSTNGISLNPHFPVMATSSGQRHFPELVSDSDIDSGDDSQPLFRPSRSPQENTVKLWWLGR